MRDYAIVESALAEDLGPCDSFVTSDAGPQGAARVLLRNSFYKKLAPKGVTAEMSANALKKFLAFNRSIPTDFSFEVTSELDSLLIDSFTDILNCALGTGSFDAFQYTDLAKYVTTGPGAAQKADNRTWVTKLFNSRATTYNSETVDLYRLAISDYGFWASAEKQRFDKFGVEVVRGCRLFFVLKSSFPEIARTCCTEALIPGVIQQGIGGWIEDYSLRGYFGINLSTQPAKNRRLTRIGSIDGSFGTADLSNASDSNSLSLFVKLVRDCPLKRAILLSRAESAVLPDGSIEKLNMVATMGNAFCFPLMTVILASAVKAVYSVLGIDAEFGVFGDDIVVRREAFDLVIKFISKLGYVVNDDKSFNAGPFRESCGHDYYSGVYIRGVYIRSLETPAEVYSAINRLGRWSADTGIGLQRTISVLRSWVRDMRIPPSAPDWAGVHVPFKLSRPLVDNNYWFKYRCFKRRVRAEPTYEPDDANCPNPDGWATGFLQGVLEHKWKAIEEQSGTTTVDKRFPLDWSLRDFPDAPPRVQIVWDRIPFWDYIAPESNPGHAWLPGGQSKTLTKEDYDPRRSLLKANYGRWEAVVEGYFNNR